LSVELNEETIKTRIEARKRRIASSVEQSAWKERERMRGYAGLYAREANGPEEGVDFRFLTATGPRG